MKILSVGECMAELSPDGQQGKFNLGFAGDTQYSLVYRQ